MGIGGRPRKCGRSCVPRGYKLLTISWMWRLKSGIGMAVHLANLGCLRYVVAGNITVPAAGAGYSTAIFIIAGNLSI